MAESDSLIHFEAASFAYEAGNTALYGMDVALRGGEVTLLAGANGSGKTSFLKLAAGFLVASEGRVLIDGHDLAETSESRLDEWIAMVRTASEKSLTGPTVEDELARACRLNGLVGPAIPERVRQALDVVKLREAQGWYLDEMSVGELRRIAIATVLIGRPRAVLLDDPLSELDEAGSRMVGRVLRELAQRGLAVVFSSHRLDEALTFSDRLLVLDQGNLVADGAPAEVLEARDQLRQAGLALPPCAELLYRLREQGLAPRVPLPVTEDDALERFAKILAR